MIPLQWPLRLLLSLLLFVSCASLPESPNEAVPTPAVEEQLVEPVETPAAPLPSPTPTATPPPPTPTRHPALAGWTIIVVTDEAPPLSLPPAPNGPANLLVEKVGDGGAAELAVRLAETAAAYPANRLALIFHGSGAGWPGLRFHLPADEATAAETIWFTLADLTLVVSQLAAAQGQKIDLLAFNAGFMGQLEASDAFQPYAHYLAAFPGPASAAAWEESRLAAGLLDDPSLEVEQLLAGQPAGPTAPIFLNLAYQPQLVAAVDRLAQQLTVELDWHFSLIGQAAATARYTLLYPGQDELTGAMNLAQFTALLAEYGLTDEAQMAAQAVLVALEGASVTGTPPPLALYFPHPQTSLPETYSEAVPLAGWPAFLDAYRQAGDRPAPLPALSLTQPLSVPVSYQSPAYLEMEIAGRDLETLFFFAGHYQEDGRVRLKQYHLFTPSDKGDGPAQWPDGVQRRAFTWPAETIFLSGPENGAFVTTWSVGYETPWLAVDGQFRPAGTDDHLPARLLLEGDSGQSERLWLFDHGLEWPPREATLAPGDEFQAYDWYRESDGRLAVEPGARFIADETGALAFGRRPAPDGAYQLGLAARNLAGYTTVAEQEIYVSGDALVEGYVVHFDMGRGFRLLYPEDWQSLDVDPGRWAVGDPAGQTRLTVVQYEDAAALPGGAAGLQRLTLELFGDVAVLYQTETTVAGLPALFTAYGYEAADGRRTGIFLSFLHEGRGYIVDIDGPESDESANLAHIRVAAENWSFQPVGQFDQWSEWRVYDLSQFVVAAPRHYTHQQPGGGWELFNEGDGLTFVAVRGDSPAAETPLEAVERWRRVAGREVAGFTAGEPAVFALAGALWTRSDFSYSDDRGREIRGMIMALEREGRLLVVWAEGPAAAYDALEREVFLIMVADLLRRR